jgi:hypothetical protein
MAQKQDKSVARKKALYHIAPNNKISSLQDIITPRYTRDCRCKITSQCIRSNDTTARYEEPRHKASHCIISLQQQDIIPLRSRHSTEKLLAARSHCSASALESITPSRNHRMSPLFAAR